MRVPVGGDTRLVQFSLLCSLFRRHSPDGATL